VIYDVANAHTFVEAFRFIGDNPGLLLHKAWQQLELAGAALGVAAVVVLPVGIVLGHFRRGSTVAIGASIFGRALPSIVLIGALLTVLGIGFLNNMVALAVLASGPMLINSYTGLASVPADVVESARGMGLSQVQSLGRVELPLASPLIFTGIRIAAVTVVATAPIAAIAGGGGLGDIIVNEPSYRLSGVIGASLCVMALCAGVWMGLVALQKAMTPRGLRVGTVNGAGTQRKELL
jgi:osmoprotectant transport system permease protein